MCDNLRNFKWKSREVLKVGESQISKIKESRKKTKKVSIVIFIFYLNLSINIQLLLSILIIKLINQFSFLSHFVFVQRFTSKNRVVVK